MPAHLRAILRPPRDVFTACFRLSRLTIFTAGRGSPIVEAEFGYCARDVSLARLMR